MKQHQKVLAASALLFVFLFAAFSRSIVKSNNLLNPSFLPLVMKMELPTPLPTPTVPVLTTGNVQIQSINFRGTGSAQPDEYFEIKNMDSVHIELQTWRLSDAQNHVFVFPPYLMAPGQVCRVYTNLNDPVFCGFSYDNDSPIWNNDHDCATLYDSSGSQISQKCY